MAAATPQRRINALAAPSLLITRAHRDSINMVTGDMYA